MNFFKLVEGIKYRKAISAINSVEEIFGLIRMFEINKVENLIYI
jgi:hypothetical protein